MGHHNVMDDEQLFKSIPASGTDAQLRERGYDLLDEYLRIIRTAGFDPMLPVLELATGPGRAPAVLSRLGYRVITGDISLEKAADMRNRLTPAFEHLLTASQLDMQHLPFRTNAVHSILCVNTVHELDDARQCVEELVRIHQPDGTLVLSDFNEEGFDLMNEIHLEVHGKSHHRGPVDLQDLLPLLRTRYDRITTADTPLNRTFILRQKRS